MAYVRLPEGYKANDVDLESVLLEGELAAEGGKAWKRLLVVKFDRSAVIDLIAAMDFEPPAEVTLTVGGEVSGIPFEGTDTVRIIDPSKVWQRIKDRIKKYLDHRGGCGHGR